MRFVALSLFSLYNCWQCLVGGAIAKNQIKLAFQQSEIEIKQLHKRTEQGLETARRNGKQLGQLKGTKLTTKKSIAAKPIILKHSKDFGGNLNDSECAAVAKIARSTFYRYKSQIIAELDKQAEQPTAKA